MTNFAKRTMIEQNIIHAIPTEASQLATGKTFDDDYEPARPSMRGGVAETEPFAPGHAYEQSDETGEVYDDSLPDSRQSSSIGMMNSRQARMVG